MADQEQNKNEDLENIEPVLDEDSFSLDLDDFDMGDDDLDVSPGIDAPNLDDISAFDDEDESISDMVASSDSYDDLLDIDLDSDLNLLGEEDPILHDEDIHADFSDYEEESEKEERSSKTPTKQSYSDDIGDDDLELEFDDDLIDLDKEIESILNGEDGILTSKKSKQDLEEEEEGPISLSLEELENITGDLEEEDHFGEPERPGSIEEENALIDEHSDLDLDLDDSEIDTNLSFDEEGKPEFDLTDLNEEGSFLPIDDLGPVDAEEEETGFQPLVDPEEEELFGKNKEDENLTLSDEELGSILGAGGEASLEETLGSEEEFLSSDDESELPSFSEDEEEGGFDLLGGEFETPEEEHSLEEEDEGPLTLSLEELENISGEAVEEDYEEPTSDILNEELEDESITLSPDELGNIIAGDPVEESEDTDEEESHELDTDLGDDFDFALGEPESDLEEAENAEEGLEGQMEGFESSDEDDDGPIALSMEELESIASDAEENSEEELVDSLDRAPLPYEEELAPKSDLLAEDEEDESIALSMEELENITASEEEDIEEEDITLSPESLDEILGEELPGEGLEDIADLPEEEEFSLSEQIGDEESSSFDLTSSDEDDLVEHEGEMDFGDLTSDSAIDDSFDLSVPDLTKDKRNPTLASDDSEEFEVDLDEYAMEGKLSPLEELRKSDVSAPESKPASEETFADVGGENLSTGDRKKVLGYLDNLLGNLPDDVIREFSKSQYFELYKKMMKELEL
ncbi:hypothetical protein [Leptospira perdikensis]|uniref:Uncharacterized protein n=1 Tax=Leptospira perdikensis TaxID=2484948 RepID=A0A4R9JM35_9LEPT|nr:hypothetical protein [Leptospira perdikensis]TGL44961.1 hypothetical protein EHQ49_05745 [Leptospira perdikensis]